MDSLLNSLFGPKPSGELLSLASGLVWSVGIILFRVSGRRVAPLALNIFKNALSLGLAVPTMLLLGRSFNPDVPARVLGLFILSGVLGIAVSDTLFFASLNRLGASFLAVIDCFYSPFVIVLSFAFLGERMTAAQGLGAVLVISAVLTVSRSEGDAAAPVSGRDRVVGIIYGILSMLFVAVGIVIIKPYLMSVSVYWATFVRLVGGLTGVLLILPFHRERRALLAPLARLGNWKAMVPAAVFGTYLSLLLWMGGMKYTQASLAAVLNQLNAVFTVVLAALFLKEGLTARKVLAVLLAFGGAILVTMRF